MLSGNVLDYFSLNLIRLNKCVDSNKVGISCNVLVTFLLGM